MSADDAWALPEANAEPAAAPAAAGTGQGAGTESEAVDAGGGEADGAVGALAGVAEQPRPREPNRVLWPIAAGLLLAAGVSQIVFLFVHSIIITSDLPNYDFLALDAFYGLRAAVLLACGALLLIRRSRELAAAIALGIAALSLARYFAALVRPGEFSQRNTVGGYWAALASYVLSLAAGVVALVVVLRMPSRTTSAGRTVRRQPRSDRVVAVLAGFGGAALWFVGECLDSFEVDLRAPDGGIAQSLRCCALSGGLDGWEQSELIAAGVAMIVLAVFAATLRSRTLGAGVVIGAVLIPLSEVAQNLMSAAAPLPSLYSVHYRRIVGDLVSIDYKLLGGFWLSLLGLLVLTATAVSRLLLGARENPYPELGGIRP